MHVVAAALLGAAVADGAGTSPAPTGPSTSTPEPERFRQKRAFRQFRIEVLDDPLILGGRPVDVERYMTEPGIEQTKETTPLDEFSDALHDEALDRGKALLVCGGFSCDPN